MTEQNSSSLRKRSRVKLAIAGFLSFIVLSLVVLVVASVFFLPGFIQSKAQEFVAEKFNRELTIRKLELDPFNLTLRLDGVRLSDPGKKTSFASFDHLFIELSARTFAGFHPVVREIRLVNPEIHLVRNLDGKSNIRDMVAYFAKPEEDHSGKTLFSINNIQIENGTIRIDDESRKKQLLIEELNIGIPFIANMPSEVDVFVRFGVSAKVNKDKIELVGKSRPGLNKKSGKLGVRLDKLDLPTYLDYLPIDPGFRLKSGKFSADLDITFARREGDRRPVYVKGGITLHSLWLTEPDHTDVLSIPELKIDIGKSDIASGKISIEHIGLKNPQVYLDRNGNGQWNVERLLSAISRPSEKTEPVESEKPSPARHSLNVELKQLAIDGGQLRVVDRVSGVRLKSDKLSARLGMDLTRSEEEKSSVFVEGGLVFQSLRLSELDGSDVFSIPELKIDIGKSDLVSGKISIERVGLQNPQVYVDRNSEGQWNVERLIKGKKTVAAKSTAAENGKPVPEAAITVDLNHLVVNGGQFRLVDRAYTKPVNVSARNFGMNVEKLFLDTGGRNLSIERVVSSGTRVQLVHSMPELLERYQGEKRVQVTEEAVKEAADRTGFHFRIKQAGIRDWALHFENRHVRQPLITQVSQLEITAENLSDSLEKPVPLFLRAHVNERGKMTVKGSFAVSPIKADMDVDIKNVDIRFIQPYIDNYVNLSLRRADLSVKGRLLMHEGQAGVLRGQFDGGAAIGNLAAVDQLTGRPVISWKDLAFEGVAINLDPFSVAIDKAKMSDVVARIILLPDGRLNLQNVLRSKAGGQKSLTENEEDTETPVHTLPPGSAPPVTSAGSVPKATPAPAGKPPVSIAIGKWIVRNGSVRFSDNFIKPRYTANILDLRGAFINLSNDPETQSRLGLRGQVNGAPLVVSGYINPLSDTLTLNIKAQVTGMELAQFSAYTGKYLGYGIEKGKLTYKATYQVQEGKLTAENSLILDQLTLGEKVESEEATDLSVELALALLKDSDGVIDINVPIAGSLNDPEFSLGSIVGKVILNTLKKVVTAPFAFLVSLSENEKALSGMVFEPGSSTLSKENAQRLEKMAKGLSGRPKLKLEITGRYDDTADRAGLGETTLNRKIRVLKRKKTGAQSFEEITVSEKEYPELLKEVYESEKFDKPRELLIFDKALPVPEMEKLLVKHYSSKADNLILLANRRAEAVKNWLVLKGKLPDDRIYLLASKKGEPEKDLPAHRVDFNLRWKN